MLKRPSSEPARNPIGTETLSYRSSLARIALYSLISVRDGASPLITTELESSRAKLMLDTTTPAGRASKIAVRIGSAEAEEEAKTWSSSAKTCARTRSSWSVLTGSESSSSDIVAIVERSMLTNMYVGMSAKRANAPHAPKTNDPTSTKRALYSFRTVCNVSLGSKFAIPLEASEC